MKTSIIAIIFLFGFLPFSRAQHLSVSLYDGNGINILDVEKSEGYTLTDWNTYSNQIVIEGLLVKENGFTLGAELGAHRLYYWERREIYYGNYIWSTLWTYNLGGIIGYTTHNFAIKAGLDLRDYADGSGVAVGFLTAADYAIPLGDKFAIPVGIRADFIPANAFTVSLNLTVGFRYRIK